MICDYKDTIELVTTVIDGYSTEYVLDRVEVPALYMQDTAWSHGSHMDAIDSDAQAYVDPANPFVIDNWNRLEEMLVVANPFGSPERIAWYRVINVEIGQDKLLCNNIDNILLTLKKTAEIASNVS